MPAGGEGRTALVVGASRTIGLALATELLQRGWTVMVTLRSEVNDAVRRLSEQYGDRLVVESLDITEPEQIRALHDRLSTTELDLVFVNAGATGDDEPAAEVPTDVFVDVMITNALSPMRVVEGLEDLVPPHGTIAVMSSRQGSISFNTRGGHEVYRASKSALNQLMRSYAARHHDDPRTLLLMHPGWVQTDLGGPGAQLTVEQSAHGVADVLERRIGQGGLEFRDYQDQIVPW